MNQNAMKKLKKMQRDMMEAQKKLEETLFTGTAGGVVTVTVYGNHTVSSVTIDPEAIESAEDVEMVQDSLVIAMNDVNKQIDSATESIMGPFSGGMPGLF